MQDANALAAMCGEPNEPMDAIDHTHEASELLAKYRRYACNNRTAGVGWLRDARQHIQSALDIETGATRVPHTDPPMYMEDSDAE